MRIASSASLEEAREVRHQGVQGFTTLGMQGPWPPPMLSKMLRLASQGVWDSQCGQWLTVQAGGDRVEEMIRLHSTPVCNVKIQHVYREVLTLVSAIKGHRYACMQASPDPAHGARVQSTAGLEENRRKK